MSFSKLLFLSSIVLLFSSCSLAFLAPKSQNVKLVGKDSCIVQLDKKIVVPDSNGLAIERDNTPHQLMFQKNGFKNDYKVCYPQKLNGYGYATIGWDLALGIPTAFVAASTIFGAEFSSAIVGFAGGSYSLIPCAGAYLFGFNSPKFLDYNTPSNTKMTKLPRKDSLTMNVNVDKVVFDVKPEKISYKSIYYHNYANKSMKSINKKTVKENGFSNESVSIQTEVNNELAKFGFVDTSSAILTSSFKNERNISATIIGYQYNFMKPFLSQIYNSNKDGFITIELDVKWELMDYYKNVLFKDTIHSTSGEFVSFVKRANSKFEFEAEKDAILNGLYEFMSNKTFTSFSKLESKSDDSKIDTLVLNTSKGVTTTVDQAIKSAVTIKSKSKIGSGLIVSSDGYILTNYHVVSDTTNLEVILNDGIKRKASVIRLSKEGDLALLKIQVQDMICFKIAEKKNFKLGKDIFVVGTPSAEDLSQSLSKGIISGVRTQQDGSTLIQTDASVNSGYSGGPMFDKDGNLIGIVSAKIVGRGVEGLAFAIPSYDVLKFIKVISK